MALTVELFYRLSHIRDKLHRNGLEVEVNFQAFVLIMHSGLTLFLDLRAKILVHLLSPKIYDYVGSTAVTEITTAPDRCDVTGHTQPPAPPSTITRGVIN